MLTGFIPLKASKKADITYTIYSKDILKAHKIKEELIVFYKQYCYSFLYDSIDKNIKENINLFNYNTSYIDHTIYVYDNENKIKMTGYLYKHTPSVINFKNYFTSSANSIPEATSIKVATLSVFDQI